VTALSGSAADPAFDPEGRLLRALQIPSPNCDAREGTIPINLLVVHSISLPPGQFGGSAVIDFFLNRLNHAAHPYFEQLRGMEVSSHFSSGAAASRSSSYRVCAARGMPGARNGKGASAATTSPSASSWKALTIRRSRERNTSSSRA